MEIQPGLAGGGGGFVHGADEVVQAYQLPKAFLPALSAQPSGATSDSEAIPERSTYDFETMDVDPDPAAIEEVLPDAQLPVRTLKTMKQLAEETAARLDKEFARHDVQADVEELVIPPPAPAPKAKKTRQAKPSKAPSERNSTKARAKGGAPARRAPAKKRRRNDGADSDSEEEEPEPSSAKRAKGSNGVPVPPATPGPGAPGRTLRPRRSKTQTQLEEEAERERIFQRAVAL